MSLETLPLPKISENSPERRIQFSEIADLEKPFQKILAEMRPEIEQGNYDFIIGEDASGRIPTLIMKQIIDAIYEAKGREKIKTFFIAGKSHLYDDYEKSKGTKQLTAHFKKINSLMANSGKDATEQRKALLVTDTIDQARSLEIIASALAANEIPFDTATVGLMHDNHDRLSEKINQVSGGYSRKIFYGVVTVPRVYGKYTISGVRKNVNHLLAERHDSYSATYVSQARQDAEILAEKLLTWYQESEQPVG